MTSEKPKKNFFSPPTRKSFFIDLSKHYLELLNSSNNFDVIIRIGEGDNYREFNAHSFILNRRSIYFNKVLSKNNWTKTRLSSKNKTSLLRFSKSFSSKLLT